MEVGEREIIYLSLHCHHQNDSCIKMGSDESHFNVSLQEEVMDKVIRQCPQTTTYTDERISTDFSGASSEFSAGTAACNLPPPPPHTLFILFQLNLHVPPCRRLLMKWPDAGRLRTPGRA